MWLSRSVCGLRCASKRKDLSVPARDGSGGWGGAGGFQGDVSHLRTVRHAVICIWLRWLADRSGVKAPQGIHKKWLSCLAPEGAG